MSRVQTRRGLLQPPPDFSDVQGPHVLSRCGNYHGAAHASHARRPSGTCRKRYGAAARDDSTTRRFSLVFSCATSSPAYLVSADTTFARRSGGVGTGRCSRVGLSLFQDSDDLLLGQSLGLRQAEAGTPVGEICAKLGIGRFRMVRSNFQPAATAIRG